MPIVSISINLSLAQNLNLLTGNFLLMLNYNLFLLFKGLEKPLIKIIKNNNIKLILS